MNESQKDVNIWKGNSCFSKKANPKVCLFLILKSKGFHLPRHRNDTLRQQVNIDRTAITLSWHMIPDTAEHHRAGGFLSAGLLDIFKWHCPPWCLVPLSQGQNAYKLLCVEHGKQQGLLINNLYISTYGKLELCWAISVADLDSKYQLRWLEFDFDNQI